ncbi:hypothetical protein FQN54_002615 [Arachnomyces sp. PD_36]|nr:hypothetical protein FQN54_002615 [Arachnomyces sp. PD_36]
MCGMTIDSTSSEMNTTGDAIPLQTSKSTLRLEQIASLRASGVGDHIDLPQLVVCGDQSAGKSSILEGITGLPFPRQDGLCTKFATEIILQHADCERTITATIIPHQSRADSIKEKLRGYKRQFESFTELPIAIEEAGTLMGIRGFEGQTEGPAFAEDILRIEVSGRLGLHLTVVDLPGLISVPNEEQTDDDVQTVHNLVNSYAQSPRTIILAVVQAGNDIANQSIVKKSRSYDKNGQRTVGIITKPDLINTGTEKRIALLAKNQDTTKLELGFFLVKNPTPTELAEGITPEQRQKNEISYFQSSPWKEQGLCMDRVGIVALRAYLQGLLDHHIEQELPKVRDEIRNLMAQTERDICNLGEERPTVAGIRVFLTSLSMRFNGLIQSALNGTYHETNSDFFSGSDSTRLRARVHQMNTKFSDTMRDYGAQRKVVGGKYLSEKVDVACQASVTEQSMKEWVKEVYLNTRGKELPGNYNYILLSELFHIQSNRWRGIADDHLTDVYAEIMRFIESALRHITKEEQTFIEVQGITSLSTQERRESAEKELEKIWEDERAQPITYNHYYTDNIQHARQDCRQKAIEGILNKSIDSRKNGRPLEVSRDSADHKMLLETFKKSIDVNMDNQACNEALMGLNAYYKVAMKTFVDNVCRQVIERHLLRDLPAIFCPESVASMDDETLKLIATESKGNMEKRKQLRELHSSLEQGLRSLRRQAS